MSFHEVTKVRYHHIGQCALRIGMTQIYSQVITERSHQKKTFSAVWFSPEFCISGFNKAFFECVWKPPPSYSCQIPSHCLVMWQVTITLCCIKTKQINQAERLKTERVHFSHFNGGTHQHGLNGGHEWGLHSEEFPGSRTIRRLLLIPQHPFNHVGQITRGLEGIVRVWIHSIQAAQQATSSRLKL